MIALADSRALLERALVHKDNPAILRLSERTVEGVARAYLARTVWVAEARPGLSALRCSVGVIGSRMRTVPLDLTDPGTAHALVVALALALGLDPGVGGVGVSWRPDGPGWRVEGVAASLDARGCVWFEQRDQDQLDDTTDPGGGYGPLTTPHTLFLHVPTVAAEPDPIKALALAVRHVLEMA